ncbi:MAG: lysine--tRNA ligase, partial [Deltaproteobacteria bacterium]|nr:lysine--tRNA ligase [Deltaproteobacteria bacterium]
MEKKGTVREDREKKIESLRDMGVNPYPAGYNHDINAAGVIERFGHMDEAELEKEDKPLSMAGRIM